MRKTLISVCTTLLASSLAAGCCLGPSLYVLFGTTVGSLGFLTGLAPLKPFLLGLAALCLGYALNRIYLRPPDFTCVGKLGDVGRINKGLFWISLGVFIVATLYPALLVRMMQ